MYKLEYWVSNDGTRFDNEERCHQHEMNEMLKKVEGKVEFFDEHKNPLSIDENLIPDSVFYIRVIDKSVIEIVSNWFDTYGDEVPFYGYDSNDCVGVWGYFDEHLFDSGWMNITEKIAELQELVDEIEGN